MKVFYTNDAIQSFAPSKNGLQTRPHVEKNFGENRNVEDLIHEDKIADQTIKKRNSHHLSFPCAQREKANSACGPESCTHLLISLIMTSLRRGNQMCSVIQSILRVLR